MIPLICIDVDGTLVGASGTVTEPVWAAVDRALERGQHLALSTARGAFGSSWEMAKRLDPSGWHVFHAGGAIVHTGTEETRGHDLPSDDVETIRSIEQADGNEDWFLELYAATAYAVESSSTASVDHAALMGLPFEASSFDDFVTEHDAIVRAQMVVPVADIAKVHKQVDPLGLSVTSATSPIMAGTAFVSITKPGVTKATGINSICEILGITIDQAMMIGDGLNDLPAIEAVGHPVAMGNAEDEVTALAKHVVASVDSDGVAEALELSATLEP